MHSPLRGLTFKMAVPLQTTPETGTKLSTRGDKMLKSSMITAIALTIGLSITALAGCRNYWEGTAPFCNSNCPNGCTPTGQFSNSGNGGKCWSGKKQLCRCCGPQIAEEGACVPNYTKTTCVGPVMMCHSVVTDEPYRECGSYACGVCIGGKFDL